MSGSGISVNGFCQTDAGNGAGVVVVGNSGGRRLEIGGRRQGAARPRRARSVLVGNGYVGEHNRCTSLALRCGRAGADSGKAANAAMAGVARQDRTERSRKDHRLGAETPVSRLFTTDRGYRSGDSLHPESQAPDPSGLSRASRRQVPAGRGKTRVGKREFLLNNNHE